MVTCWERADLLALIYVMFYCVFVTFTCGVLGKVWCMIVSILDLNLLSYYEMAHFLQNKQKHVKMNKTFFSSGTKEIMSPYFLVEFHN